jgi:hypothetical protein
MLYLGVRQFEEDTTVPLSLWSFEIIAGRKVRVSFLPFLIAGHQTVEKGKAGPLLFPYGVVWQQ